MDWDRILALIDEHDWARPRFALRTIADWRCRVDLRDLILSEYE